MKVFINPSTLNIEANGLQAKDVTLSIAQKVAAHLNAAGITTELQQHDSVEAIYTASNNAGADLFVAIHCNSATSNAAGTETFFCQGSTKGETLARAVQSRIIAALGCTDRGIKDDTQSASGSLGVLRKTACPAALVEVAFISNVNDAQLLRNRQDDFALAIAAGIGDYSGITISQAPPIEAAPPIININFDVIAAEVRKYEEKDDVATITEEGGDTLYGIYKFSSNKKIVKTFVDWLCNHSDVKLANYGNDLAQDPVDSEAFKETWTNLATVDPGNFSQLQDEFVKTNYFDKAVAALFKEYFHLDKHSDALKRAIFTKAYQNGVEGCVNAVKGACTQLGYPNLSYIDSTNFDGNIVSILH